MRRKTCPRATPCGEQGGRFGEVSTGQIRQPWLHHELFENREGSCDRSVTSLPLPSYTLQPRAQHIRLAEGQVGEVAQINVTLVAWRWIEALIAVLYIEWIESGQGSSPQAKRREGASSAHNDHDPVHCHAVVWRSQGLSESSVRASEVRRERSHVAEIVRGTWQLQAARSALSSPFST